MSTRFLNVLLLVGCALCALTSPAAWAPPLPLPSKVLQSQYTQVVVGSYRDRLADGRYRFGAIENIRGPDEPPGELLVRGPDWLAAWLSPKQSYLFAYTAYLRNPRFRKETLVDTDGPRLIDAPGLEPALFLDSAGLRETLLHKLDRDTLGSDAYLAAVIAGLSSSDTQLQNFHATELGMLGELQKRGDAELVEAVKSLLENGDGHASARAALLRTVAANADVYSRDYLAGVVQKLILQAPLTGYQDLQPRSGELVGLALQLVQAHALPVTTASLERLVGCDSAALAEAALLAIRRVDPEHERSAARHALEQTQLPATSREFLLDHLRRLDLTAGHSLQSKPKS